MRYIEVDALYRSSAVALVVAVCAIFLGCVSCAKKDSDPNARMDMEIVHERLRKSGGGTSWVVSWRFSMPVHGLRFLRQKSAFRGHALEPIGRGLRITKSGDTEILLAPVPTTEFRLRFRNRPVEVQNDYPFLTRFSDGGAVFYTGYLLVEPFQCPDGSCSEVHQVSSVPIEKVITHIRPLPGEAVIVNDQRYSGAVSFESVIDGLVYFGKLKIQKAETYSAVFDPRLPAWVRHDMTVHLPRLIRHFSNVMGYPLDGPPIIFFPYPHDKKEKLEQTSGSVVGRQILLSVAGKGWLKRNRSRREEFFRLLAHESFHLWNAHLFQSQDRADGAWLHEGSAEALSQRALLDLGLLKPFRYIQLQIETLNRCIVGRDMPTSNGIVSRSQAIRAHYDCGAAFHFLLQMAALRSEAELSPYGLWVEIFRRAEQNNRVYTHEIFTEIATRLVNPELTEHVSKFEELIKSGSDVYFLEAFRDAGIYSTILVDNFPFWYHRLISRRAIEMLVAHDCKGKGYYTFTDNKIELIGGNECTHIKSGQRIRGIESYALYGEGVQAYDYLQQTCQMRPGADVYLRGTEHPLRIACVPLPRRPHYLFLNRRQISRVLFRENLIKNR